VDVGADLVNSQVVTPVPLLLMADFGADPLWHRTSDGNGSAMIPLDRLPLTDGLRDRLRSWATRADELNDPPFSWGSQPKLDDWVADGRVLLILLRAELGPAYDVQYSP
jgi:hypothetical protein